jgi:hypothetical protein
MTTQTSFAKVWKLDLIKKKKKKKKKKKMMMMSTSSIHYFTSAFDAPPISPYI